MIRWIVLMSMLLATAGFVSTSAAQEPTAKRPGIGDKTALRALNGEPVGTVSILQIVEPFEDFNLASTPPARGYHWIMVEVQVATTTVALPVNSYGFQLVDSAGYISSTTYVDRPQESYERYPDLSSNELPKGQSTTGVLFFQIFNEAKVALINYAPEYEQSIVVLDLRESATELGSTVTWVSGEGEPIGEITVEGIIDPITDYQPSSSPSRGFRYIGIVVTVTNLGAKPFRIDVYRFSIIDNEGYVKTADSIYRNAESVATLPDLAYVEIAPGDFLTGLVGFELINPATIKTVIFSPENTRALRLAEIESTSATSSFILTPAPAATPNPDCTEVMAWSKEMDRAAAPLNASFELVDLASSGDPEATPAGVRESAAVIASVADAVEALAAPAAARATAEQFATTIRSMGDTMSTIADAIEANDQAAVDDAVAAFYNLALSVASGPYEELVLLCPEFGDS
jgi:hypothetical protein